MWQQLEKVNFVAMVAARCPAFVSVTCSFGAKVLEGAMTVLQALSLGNKCNSTGWKSSFDVQCNYSSFSIGCSNETGAWEQSEK